MLGGEGARVCVSPSMMKEVDSITRLVVKELVLASCFEVNEHGSLSRPDMREIYSLKSNSIHIRREALSIPLLSGESMTSHSLGQSKLYYVLVLVEQ